MQPVTVRSLAVTIGGEQERGVAAFDHRASLANARRREETGEVPVMCGDCGAETDVAQPAHAWACSRRGIVAVAESDEVEEVDPVVVEIAAPKTSLDYQASVIRADARGATDDFDLEICGWCGCEVDVEEPAHRPDCPGVGKPRASEISTLAIATPIRVEERPATVDRQRAALRVLDEGTPQSEFEAGASDSPAPQEVEELEDRPAEADATSTTSGGGQDAEGADGAIPADSRVGGAPKRRGRKTKWNRETILTAFARWKTEHGAAPKSTDWLHSTAGVYPSCSAVVRDFGSWNALMDAAGEPRRSSGGQPGNANKRGKTKTAAAAVKGSSGTTRGADGHVARPDEEQPTPGEVLAATADGSGAAGAATPAADPDQAVRVARILNEVGEELAGAIERHETWHSPHEGHAIIREEFEELWDHVKANTGRGAAARAEAIQLAAMAARYVLDLSEAA